jgi:methionyl-tRNA synthetase
VPAHACRYYLTRGGVYGSDVPYSEEALMVMHNADLADTLGNLIHRVANLSLRMTGGVVPDVAADVIFDVARLRQSTETAFASFALQARCAVACRRDACVPDA